MWVWVINKEAKNTQCFNHYIRKTWLFLLVPTFEAIANDLKDEKKKNWLRSRKEKESFTIQVFKINLYCNCNYNYTLQTPEPKSIFKVLDFFFLYFFYLFINCLTIQLIDWLIARLIYYNVQYALTHWIFSFDLFKLFSPLFQFSNNHLIL